MTNGLTVIDAEFVSFRTVQGRKCLQLVLEIPIERTTDVLTKLGTPVGGSSLWVAVALLDKEKAGKPETAQVSEANGSSKPDKRKWDEIPLSQQAAIRCGEPAFQALIAELSGSDAGGPDAAAAFVRNYCGVESRSQITERAFAIRRWLELEARYQSYLTDQRFGGAKR